MFVRKKKRKKEKKKDWFILFEKKYSLFENQGKKGIEEILRKRIFLKYFEW